MPPTDRWIDRFLLLTISVALSLVAPAHHPNAQDSCAVSQMSVSPCLAGEEHVSSGGTVSFEVTNYAYAQDAYYVRPKCSGIVSVCRGGGYYYADPESGAEVDISYTINQQS